MSLSDDLGVDPRRHRRGLSNALNAMVHAKALRYGGDRPPVVAREQAEVSRRQKSKA